ncbi:MAG: hypothetical protein KJ964_14100 [Verrucomicrobia bacterium]|nr:hypothetical protein [Verrucomicrobiota bacterium]MBU1734773.1 hypothetical protein [Verrucomicrobiota bacterium]MBU1857792.1 hypothetical protein [Verrucomicrobiota bacterium]
MNQEETGKAYGECILMLNGLDKSFERRPPRQKCRWAVAKAADEYDEPNTEH